MPAPCQLCGYPAYGVAVHPCCAFWRDVIEAGRPCPGCSESRRARHQQELRREREIRRAAAARRAARTRKR